MRASSLLGFLATGARFTAQYTEPIQANASVTSLHRLNVSWPGTLLRPATTRRSPLSVSAKPTALAWTETHTFDDAERSVEAEAVTDAFDPASAADVLRQKFEHQIAGGNDAGMTPDVVGFRTPAAGPGHSGLLNTKPLLEGWATWQVHRAGQDKNFLAEMRSRPVAEHDWWLHKRDHDHNCLLGYGTTPTADSNSWALTAAAQESGRDSELRFDVGKGLHDTDENGNLIGCSLNQESVGLNAFMANSDCGPARITAVPGKSDDASAFEAKTTDLDGKTQGAVFDPATNYFHDTRLGTDALYKHGDYTHGSAWPDQSPSVPQASNGIVSAATPRSGRSVRIGHRHRRQQWRIRAARTAPR
ncbi:MGH1-like glycoside hydrolase domain-containing protein [Kitasatospora cineracea]|uniref:Mannosylglycerate hydrolase MGH1-like glycoside hydrolase domain-containing protein n=1 Tax=Kitasatospora cineracea TaxID=88074 RepID=A0A8G1XGK5_9ACTN|nr:hypothetical protein [Kitasatospora cineracea]ROR46417.1 hypothetical protein EDD39_4686 [Kitasatospora cineracea]